MELDNEFKPKKVRAKTNVDQSEHALVIEPEKIVGSRVFIPSQCVAVGREQPSGDSNPVMTFHNEDELYIDGFRNNGMWTWYHDTRGFWIESKQVVCLIDVKEV